MIYLDYSATTNVDKEVLKAFNKACFDIVVTNPPYKKMGTGIHNKDESNAASRHEIFCTLDEIIAKGKTYIKDNPNLKIILGRGYNDDYLLEKRLLRKNDLDKIFERLYRAEQSRSKQVGGHGLGLSIAKIIVLGHKGKIKVKSTPGKGSEFSLLFPYLDSWLEIWKFTNYRQKVAK